MTTNEQSTGLENLGTHSASEHFQNQIDGVYGMFSTPSGVVCYLQTKAKLGGDGSKHFQLTKSLVPAREALNVEEMDFNQLLQRDLDDHRIATTLIPYILNPPVNQLPGFFPPIVAVILPFDHSQNPVDHFELPIETFSFDAELNARFRMVTHSGAYRAQYMVDKNDQPTKVPIGCLRWNPDTAKLVIMDGQHRAMSLLAIQRTVSNTWDAAPRGSRYRPFYEESIRKMIDQAAKNGNPVDLNKVELPVTICWFPERPTDQLRIKPHMAARKLFVDVNNTAKQPSEARLVLLSDTKLENILARELLNRLRKDMEWRESFPLFGVEYDNPVASVSTPRRWSVVTNLEILKDAVIRAVFGPPKLISSMNASLSGKPPLKEMDRQMRVQLKVSDLFAKEFHDGARLLQRDRLGNSYFPLNDSLMLNKLLDSFYGTWGRGILRLISGVEPYKAHLKALRDRYSDWTAAENVQTLAKDALFEGVGMFWTIEDGHELWLDLCREAKEEKRAPPPQPDVSRAWNILDGEQKTEFRKRRSEVYLGSTQPHDIDECDALLKSLITYASQVGLVLAWASICRSLGKGHDPLSVAEMLVLSINQTLCTGPVASRDRKRILLKQSQVKGFKPLNSLPKLEPAYANYFRYFWLELAFHENDANWSALQKPELEACKQMLDDARKSYINLLINERKKVRAKDTDVLNLDPSLQVDKANELAKAEIVEEQSQAHQYWFGGKISDCRTRITMTIDRASATSDDSSDGELDEDEMTEELQASAEQI
jgi:hypothetical protein